MANCIDCKHMGMVSRDDKTECQVLLFCRAITLVDGSHPVCGVERADISSNECGVNAALFEPRY